MSYYTKTIIDILKKADEIEDKDQRAEYLRAYMRPSVRRILAAFHNESVEFEKGLKVEYSTKRNRNGISDSTLDREVRRLYLFTTECNIEKARKKTRLIQILESLCEEEAKFLYENVLQKDNPYKKINRNFIKKYFPEILTASVRT